MSVRIIIDSTADHTPAVREKCTVVPLTVCFDGTEYTDGVTITHGEFYEKLVTSETLPTTSQPTPHAFARAFQECVDAGDQAVVITISSRLSGTYQSATIAAMDFEGDIFVVDSRSAAIGSGILAEYALQLAAQGMSAAEITGILIRERENVCLVALVDTLEYLKKGGRVSATVAFAGELLSIKPIISLPDGRVEVVSKARGTKQAQINLDKQIQAAGGIDPNRPVLSGFTGNYDASLEHYLASSTLCPADVGRAYIGSAIGTHVGPNAVAVAFFKQH